MSSDEIFLRNREKFVMERSTELRQYLSETPVVNPDFFGPSLPPHLLKPEIAEIKPKTKIYGPVLPEILTNVNKPNEHLKADSDTKKTESRSMIGPEIPKHFGALNMNNASISDEDEDTFGPSPNLMATDAASSYEFVVHQSPNKQFWLLRRVENLVRKEKLCFPLPLLDVSLTFLAMNNFSGLLVNNPLGTVKSTAKRESWMLELPTKKIGLGQRHFRTRIQTCKDSDQSSWTDTPEDKQKKEKSTMEKDLTDVLKKKQLEERDKEMEVLAKKAAKKLRKEKSLLEIHRKNMKKKKKETKKQGKVEAQAAARRPFDRNKDLQIHKFDENQKRAILNKARFLNDRFASGESKFL